MLSVVPGLIRLNQHIRAVGMTFQRKSVLVNRDIPDLMLLRGLCKCLQDPRQANVPGRRCFDMLSKPLEDQTRGIATIARLSF